MIFQCVINAFGAFMVAFLLLIRIVLAGGINWRMSLETELNCCDVARITLLDFRREHRVRRTLHFLLDYIGLSTTLIGYEEPTLSACDGPLQTLVRNTLQGLHGAAAGEEVLRRLDAWIFWPKMFLLLNTVATTMLFFRWTKKIDGMTAEETWINDGEEDDDYMTERNEVDKRELEEGMVEKDEMTEEILEISIPGFSSETTSSKDHEPDNCQEENVDEVPLQEPQQEVEDVLLKVKKEIRLISGDLYEFPLSDKEKLILRKIAGEVREFTKFYNVRLVLPEDNTKEVAHLEGAENRVEMAFQHLQEILDEYEREGHDIDAADLDMEELSPPPEELVNEPEIGLNFAAILKRGRQLEKEKKETFVIVQRRTFPIMKEWLEEEDESEEFESYLEDDWEIEEEDWEYEEEEKMHKIIVGISLREAPEEDGHGFIKRRLLKCVPRQETCLPHEEEEDDASPQEEAEEEKVPLEKKEEPANDVAKDEATGHQEEIVKEAALIRQEEEERDQAEEKEETQTLIVEKEEERNHVEDQSQILEKDEEKDPLDENEETHNLTRKGAEEENVLEEEKEENVLPPEEKDIGSEGMVAKVEEEPEKMSYANMAKVLPEPKSAGPIENTTTKPTGPVKTLQATRPAPRNNWKTTRPAKCGPLKQCVGKTFSFQCEKDLDLGQIIGKGGKFAKMARQDHGVVMNVLNDGSRMVKLTGPKRNVEKVYKEIRFRVDKVFDISELTQVSEGMFAVGKEDFVMTVDQEFREAIVGPQDLTLRKLIREYDVAIYLPDEDDQRHYISIFGPLKQAQEAERAISTMIDDIKNFSAEKDLKLVSSDWYQFELGLEGRRLLLALNGQGPRELRNIFKVNLILPKEDDQREIGFLGGELKEVKKAYDHLRVLLEELSLRNCDITTEGLSRIGAGQYRLEVDAEHKGLLVGPKGDNLRKIEKYNNVKIIVHKKTDGFVTIQGMLDYVQDACVDIREAMKPLVPKGKDKIGPQGGRNLPEEEIVPRLTRIEDRLYRIMLDREERAMVIGRGGQNIKRLVREHKIIFQGPKVDETSNNCTVRGNEKDVVAFFHEVEEIVKAKGQQRKFDRGQQWQGAPSRNKRGTTLGDFF